MSKKLSKQASQGSYLLDAHKRLFESFDELTDWLLHHVSFDEAMREDKQPSWKEIISRVDEAALEQKFNETMDRGAELAAYYRHDDPCPGIPVDAGPTKQEGGNR